MTIKKIGKRRNSSKKTIARFTNRKFAKQVLYNKKGLKSIDKSTLGLTNDIVINENLTTVKKRIEHNCRKRKRQNCISKTYTVNCVSKTYTVNGMVQLIRNNIKR